MSSGLFAKSSGSGTELVLLHGWGMNGDVWDTVAAPLAEGGRVTTLDLPGHGRSGTLDDYCLPAQAAHIADSLPPRSVLIGWSLGGLIAQQLALDFPRRIEALVLVASSPRFVCGDDWPEAMQAGILESFATELKTDYARTINRFLAIQALGGEHARDELRLLRERVFRHGEPRPAALAGGLDILMRADLRARLPALRCPVLLVSGERDTLFPLAAARRTRALLHDARLEVIAGAGHAPFLSHPGAFLETLQAFLDNLK